MNPDAAEAGKTSSLCMTLTGAGRPKKVRSEKRRTNAGGIYLHAGGEFRDRIDVGYTRTGSRGALENINPSAAVAHLASTFRGRSFHFFKIA